MSEVVIADESPGSERRAALLRESLAAFEVVRLRVTGECMRPTLSSGDVVRLVHASMREPRVGDVVLVESGEGPRLHRLVFSFAGRIRTRGDRGPGFDGPRRLEDALATVVGVERGPRLVPVFSPARAFFSLARGLVRRLRRATSRP
jgi:hypothetical protein